MSFVFFGIGSGVHSPGGDLALHWRRITCGGPTCAERKPSER